MNVERLEDFALERYFARWEFAVDHQLSASDIEPYTLSELLALADADSLSRWDALSLGYTESAGLPALREEVARTYRQLDPACVITLAGAEEGIFLAMHALLTPGDDLVVVTPAYQSLHSIGRAIGARVVEVPLRADRGWLLDPEEVARAVTSRTKVLAINFPHNPTGSHITRDVQRRLVEVAETAGAVLFSDEVYRGLEYRTDEAVPPAADLSETAVSLGVMSKSYALAGLRIGWLATRNTALLNRIARLKDYTTICNSAPSEILALIAVRATDRVLARSRAIVADNLECARAFFASRQEHLGWIPPRAGSVAFPAFVSRNAEDFSREIVERDRVLLMPGSVFGSDTSRFRLGLGRRDLPIALEKFGEALQKS
jgi:aspartate/methionine/tyrosine aminotransferase